MANFRKLTSCVVLLCLCISIAQAQHGIGGERGTPSRSSFRDKDYEALSGSRATQFRATPANNVNNGVVKALEAKIAAMEELIREYEEKEVVIREHEHALEQNRLALEERMRKEEKRIREREIGLDKREAEITAYQNRVLKDQDERERRLEVLTRSGC